MQTRIIGSRSNYQLFRRTRKMHSNRRNRCHTRKARPDKTRNTRLLQPTGCERLYPLSGHHRQRPIHKKRTGSPKQLLCRNIRTDPGRCLCIYRKTIRTIRGRTPDRKQPPRKRIPPLRRTYPTLQLRPEHGKRGTDLYIRQRQPQRHRLLSIRIFIQTGNYGRRQPPKGNLYRPQGKYRTRKALHLFRKYSGHLLYLRHFRPARMHHPPGPGRKSRPYRLRDSRLLLPLCLR